MPPRTTSGPNSSGELVGTPDAALFDGSALTVPGMGVIASIPSQYVSSAIATVGGSKPGSGTALSRMDISISSIPQSRKCQRSGMCTSTTLNQGVAKFCR
jgi:hypothetical protein